MTFITELQISDVWTSGSQPRVWVRTLFKLTYFYFLIFRMVHGSIWIPRCNINCRFVIINCMIKHNILKRILHLELQTKLNFVKIIYKFYKTDYSVFNTQWLTVCFSLLLKSWMLTLSPTTGQQVPKGSHECMHCCTSLNCVMLRFGVPRWHPVVWSK